MVGVFLGTCAHYPKLGEKPMLITQFCLGWRDVGIATANSFSIAVPARGSRGLQSRGEILSTGSRFDPASTAAHWFRHHGSRTNRSSSNSCKVLAPCRNGYSLIACPIT